MSVRPIGGAAAAVMLCLAACGSQPAAAPDAAASPVAATTPDRGDAPADAASAADPAPVAAATPAAPAASPATASPAAATDTMRSCAQEIGTAAATQRAKICRRVSPATHPPCNAANSCAMIEYEIARSCALLERDGPADPACAPTPSGSAAAAAVVRRYYQAIAARDYATAWQQWGDDGPHGQSLAAFGRGFAHTRATRVAIGRLAPSEGAAGSTYQTVPVTVDATLDSGERQRFVGSYVLRRVNDVDGASAEQRRWHIDSAKLTRQR